MPRSSDENRRLRDERREQILSRAVRLFATRGLAGTKVADIAAAVGMSQGLLYHYFAAKEAIYVEIVRRAFARMNSAALELEQQARPPREKLELAAAAVARGLEQSEDFAWYSVLISAASLSDAVPAEAKRIIRRERDVPYQAVARIARAGQRDGSVKAHPPEDLALVFWNAVKGLALHKAALGGAFRAPDPRVLSGIFLEQAAP